MKIPQILTLIPKIYQSECCLCIYFSYIYHAVYHFYFFKDTK